MRLLISLLALSFFCALPNTARAALGVPPPATQRTTPTQADVAAAVADYKAELAAMSGKERRSLKRAQRREMKDALRQYRASVRSGAADVEEGSALLVILAILLPPLAVYLHQGEINSKFWISLLLTLLVILPGIIYALLVVTGNAKK